VSIRIARTHKVHQHIENDIKHLSSIRFYLIPPLDDTYIVYRWSKQG
jgi:hypothetical protein